MKKFYNILTSITFSFPFLFCALILVACPQVLKILNVSGASRLKQFSLLNSLIYSFSFRELLHGY